MQRCDIRADAVEEVLQVVRICRHIAPGKRIELSADLSEMAAEDTPLAHADVAAMPLPKLIEDPGRQAREVAAAGDCLEPELFVGSNSQADRCRQLAGFRTSCAIPGLCHGDHLPQFGRVVARNQMIDIVGIFLRPRVLVVRRGFRRQIEMQGRAAALDGAMDFGAFGFSAFFCAAGFGSRSAR